MLLGIVTITIACHQVEPRNPSSSSRSFNLAQTSVNGKKHATRKMVSSNVSFLLKKKGHLYTIPAKKKNSEHNP